MRPRKKKLNPKACSITGCDEPSRARGMCFRCYREYLESVPSHLRRRPHTHLDRHRIVAKLMNKARESRPLMVHLDRVCQWCDMNKATTRNVMAKAGVKWQDIKDRLRRQRLCGLIADSMQYVSAKDMAWELGFASTQSFCRWFEAQYGRTYSGRGKRVET